MRHYGGECRTLTNYLKSFSALQTHQLLEIIELVLNAASKLQVPINLDPNTVLVFIDGKKVAVKVTEELKKMEKIICNKKEMKVPVVQEKHEIQKEKLMSLGQFIYYVLEGKKPFKSGCWREPTREITLKF